MRRVWIGMAVAVGAIAVAAILTEADPPMDPNVKFKAFKPVQSLERQMESQGQLFGDLKDSIIDKAWDEAETMAWLLAELGNVNHFQSTDSQYQEFADLMSADCVALAKNLKKHNMTEAKKALTTVSNRCKACHKVFKKDS